MTVVVTHGTPAPGKVKRRAAPDLHKSWSERLLAIRTCLYCKTVYLTAGDASVCEHFHEGL